MNTTRASLLVSFAEKYTLLVLNIVATMLIARLLTPADIGIYSVGAVLVGLAQVLRDFGVGQYLIQDRELNQATLRAAFAISLGVAWTLALLVLAASGPVAQFYHEDDLRHVLRVLAINFVLLPFSSLTLPLLRRQLRFSAIYAINVANSLASLLVSVTLAWRGHGTMSLAWGALAGTCASVLACLVLRPPCLPWWPSLTGVRKLLHFGMLSTGGGAVDEIGVAAPDLIIGKLLDVAAVGIFSKALGLLGVFNQAITSAVSPVLFPLFSQQARDGHDVRLGYLTSMSYLTAISWPFFAFLGLLALPIVNLFYGPQWDAAVPLIQIMCFSSALNSMFNMARYFFIATGHVKAQAQLDACATPVRLLAILLAAPHGLAWVAWAVLLGSVFRTWLTLRYLRRHAALHLPAVLKAVWRSLLLTGCTALAPLLVLASAPALPQRPWLGLLLAGAGAAIAWLLGVFLLKHEIAGELEPLRRKVLGLAAAGGG